MTENEPGPHDHDGDERELCAGRHRRGQRASTRHREMATSARAAILPSCSRASRAFVAVSAVVICTPGQDTALTIRNTLSGGRRSGIATAAGVALGQAVWTLAASAGLVALLSASEPAFRALKLAGAAYLVYLGAQTLWTALAGEAPRTAKRQMSTRGRATHAERARFARASSATSATRRWRSSSRACCPSSRRAEAAPSPCCSRSASSSAR